MGAQIFGAIPMCRVQPEAGLVIFSGDVLWGYAEDSLGIKLDVLETNISLSKLNHKLHNPINQLCWYDVQMHVCSNVCTL